MEQWLPRGTSVTTEKRIKKMISASEDWQIYSTNQDSYVLAATHSIYKAWIDKYSLPEGIFCDVNNCKVFHSSGNYLISSLDKGPYPENNGQVEAFSIAFNTAVKLFPDVDLRDAVYIIDYILSRGATLNMISNGRRITDEFLDFIAERGVSICISVPGIETFAEHTGIDNIEHVLSLFEKTQAKGIQATANIAVTKKNLPELYENIAYALIKGADYVLLNRFLPGGRGLKNQEFLLTREEINQMLDIAEEVLSKANKHGHVGTEMPLCAINDPQKYKHIRVSNLCSAAKGFCIIDPSGYLKVCNHSPIRVCRYDEIECLQGNAYWNAFRQRNYLPDMCKDCDKRDRCDGGCREAAHVYHGKIDDPDPIFE